MQISSCCSDLGRDSKMQRRRNKESHWFPKASPPKPWQGVGAGDPWNHSCRQSPSLGTEGSLVPSYLRTPFLLQGSFDFVRGFFPPPLPGSFLLSPTRPSPLLPCGCDRPFPSLARGARALTSPPVLSLENLTLAVARIS